MSKWGNTDFSNLKELAARLDEFTRVNTLVEDVAKELTARLLGKVIPRTPVGQYSKASGKLGGTLRRGWTTQTQNQAESGQVASVIDYVNSLEVKKLGKYVIIPIINPVEYASFVEQGHKTRGGKTWVKGRHMLRISIQELENDSPKIIKRKLEQALGEVFK